MLKHNTHSISLALPSTKAIVAKAKGRDTEAGAGTDHEVVAAEANLHFHAVCTKANYNNDHHCLKTDACTALDFTQSCLTYTVDMGLLR